MPGERYDAVPYLSLPYPGCHPDALAVVAQLAGLEIPSPAGWRVLDLGCGDGGNLLAVAQSLPGARCLGIDANAAALERGRATAAEAGLGVELRHGDLTDLPADLGVWDAIIVHGVWSWGGESVRATLPATLARLLAPRGIAHVSYLALPGAHLLAPAREVARRWAGREPDPERQIAMVRSCVEELLALGGPAAGGAYAGLLRSEARRWATRPDFLLFHDILDPDATPFALEGIAEEMAGAGLAWLGESRPEAWWRWRVDAAQARRIEAFAGDAPRHRQEAYDDLSGPVFKASLWMHADAAPRTEAGAERALELHVARPVGAPAAPDGEAANPLRQVLTPEPVRVADAVAAANLEPGAGAEAALRLAGSGDAVLTRLGPAWTLDPGARPQASGLARAQAARGHELTTLRHSVRTLDHELLRTLLLRLDGTRSRPQLCAELAPITGRTPAALAAPVEKALTLLGEMALLVPPR